MKLFKALFLLGLGICAALGFVVYQWLVAHVLGKTYVWHQAIEASFETPQGPLTARSVGKAEVTHYSGGLFMAGTAWAQDYQGEALAVELGDGVLFVTLGGPNLARSAYKDLAATQYEVVVELSRAGSLPKRALPLDRIPDLVLFDDLEDPSSARVIAPESVPDEFGPGYEMSGLHLEITSEDVSPGRLIQYLPWLFDGSLRETSAQLPLPLNERDFVTAEIDGPGED